VPPKDRLFLTTGAQAGLTVLAAMRQWMPGTSWSAVRKLMAARRIVVNDVLCVDETRRIKEGDTVTLAARMLEPPPSSADVRLRWVDDDVIVVEKPAGMITLRHHAERNWSPEKKRLHPALDDLLPELIARTKSRPAQGRHATRIYSVHRIDRGTSGLLVFARTPQAREHLVKQFRKHTVERTYLAVAEGEVAAQTFDSFLVLDRGDGRRGSTKVAGIGRRAVTHVRPIEQLDGFTLLECRLETGRTHQIRIHLSESGHPIYGDALYGIAALRASNSAGTARPALHAATLGFDHPKDGKRLRFQSPPPDDLASLIQRLR
jgi:23S rRNA pseudouridine1911/1915/1917 synthase